MPVLYWLKNGNQLGFSSRRKSTTRQDSETNVLESSIEFVSPNESDLGSCLCCGASAVGSIFCLYCGSSWPYFIMRYAKNWPRR